MNPIPENSRSLPVSESTKSLAHGSLLCGIFLPKCQQLVIGCDDLEDFYHCYMVSNQHASRNHIHGVFDASDFRGWNCWRPELEGIRVVGCFRTLAMGTSFAVEVAQHSHTNLSHRAGCLSPKEQVRYRAPLPRGPVYQLLCIDDYAVIAAVPLSMNLNKVTTAPSDRPDLGLLEKASAAYEDAHLRTSKKKSVRNSSRSVVLGCELDGLRGSVQAPCLRVLALCRITLMLLQVGCSTRHLLESILGSWIFVLLFRRPLFALLSNVFNEGRDLPEHQVFVLSTGAKQELMLLILFAPFSKTNIRAEPLDTVYASDASLEGAGICSAHVGASAVLELCRISEQKGFYTRIDDSTLGQVQSRLGNAIYQDPPSIPLPEGFLWDFIEIFRGRGCLSAAHERAGFRVHDGIDNIIDPENDILFNSTMLYLVGLVARRVVRVWHFAPICTTFGTLRRPRLRSKHQLFGFNPESADTRKGNLFAVRTALLLNLCLRYGLLCSVEQPASSVMYRLWMFQELLQHMFSIKFPFCSFGTPFQKGSWWLSNNPEMTKLASVCQCGYKGKHFAVRGTFTQDRLEEFKRRCRPNCFAVFDREPVLHEPVARFSGGYPRPLCDRVAMLNLFHVENSVDDFSCNIQRPISSPPMWIGEFGKCLKWKKVLQFRFRKRNHINIDENLAFRSLLKHLAKSRPGSRFCTFLDSRVVIGSSAKGRSSSQQLNFYMSTALPYLVGGDLYPHYLHIGTKENPADDLSRFAPLRNPDRALPTWLFELQQGNFDRFELIQSADSLLWPFSGWARLGLLLVFRDRCNPQECNGTN